MIQHLQKSLANRPELQGAALERMAAHWELLSHWNQRVNLTAIVDSEEAAYAHYADSLAAVDLLKARGPVLDVGSGGGFPGVVLAIALPHVQFTLLEPRQKRISFLQTVQARLDLRNVRLLCGRLEDRPDQTYASAVSRAVFSDAQMFELTAPWLKSKGRMLAYRAVDAPAVKTHCAVSVHPYEIRGRARRIDVWTFP